MPFASFALAALQMSAPVSLDSGFAVNQAMSFQQDGRGNRIIVSGAGQASASSVSGNASRDRLMMDWGRATALGQATAIGNLISVTVTGNNNTVVLDTTQINLGDQTAIVGQVPSGSGG
jgi:holdfast attachment protein HfaA